MESSNWGHLIAHLLTALAEILKCMYRLSQYSNIIYIAQPTVNPFSSALTDHVTRRDLTHTL